MSAEVKVPPFPESVEEGTLTTWHKQEGDAVARDEKIADIETDKIVLEVTAPDAGVLSGVTVKEGETVKPGQLLAGIVAGEGRKGEAPATPPVKLDDETPDAKPAPAPQQSEDEATEGGGAAVKMSPAVRRMIEENDLDAGTIKGTGRDGMITKADVLKAMEAGTAGKQAAPAPAAPEAKETPKAAAAPANPPKAAAKPVVSAADGRPEKRVPMTRIRARIAERLVEAQQTAAILTTFNEVDMKPVMDLRNRYKDRFEKTSGVKLGFMSFFVKAAVEALKEFPVVNATLDGSDIVYHGYYDVGVAVSTDRGLVVPILRDADQLSFAAIEQRIVDFAGRAREGKLSMEDLTGGTFSITNGGIFGSMLSTPILNPPQSAILGMHKIQERPVVEDGQIVVRPIMYLALSYDHRLIDGRDAVQFLVTIKSCLEDPARMLLDV